MGVGDMRVLNLLFILVTLKIRIAMLLFLMAVWAGAWLFCKVAGINVAGGLPVSVSTDSHA